MNIKSIAEEILNSVDTIPMLSPSASLLLTLCADPQHSLGDVVKIAKNDAVLTARLLKIVNSPAYSRSVTITDMDRAVSLLGENLVVGLALEEAASSLFMKTLSGYESGGEDLWRHDLKTAIAAKRMTRFSKVPQSAELAFTCGLLHDLGKTVLTGWLANAPGQKEIIEKIETGQFGDFLEAEENILGLTHADAGYAMAMHWALPAPLPDVIRFHHTPARAPEDCRSLAYIVHLGDTVAMMGGSGTGTDNLRYKMDLDFPKYLQLSTEDIALLFLEVEEEFNLTITALG